MRADQYLEKAASIMAERAKTYDSESGERSMGKAVDAFNTITGQDVTEAEGWLLLQVLKDVRQWSKKGYHSDSAEDCIAYAALKAEALENDEHLNNMIRDALSDNYDHPDAKHWVKHHPVFDQSVEDDHNE